LLEQPKGIFFVGTAIVGKQLKKVQALNASHVLMMVSAILKGERLTQQLSAAAWIPFENANKRG
jgi:hypothetical protein